MRTDTQVNKRDCLVMHYPAVEKYVGISQSAFTTIIRSKEAGVPSGVIREFNSEKSTCTIVKKGQDVTRRRAVAVYLNVLPKELQEELNAGYYKIIYLSIINSFLYRLVTGSAKGRVGIAYVYRTNILLNCFSYAGVVQQVQQRQTGYLQN